MCVRVQILFVLFLFLSISVLVEQAPSSACNCVVRLTPELAHHSRCMHTHTYLYAWMTMVGLVLLKVCVIVIRVSLRQFAAAAELSIFCVPLNERNKLVLASHWNIWSLW